MSEEGQNKSKIQDVYMKIHLYNHNLFCVIVAFLCGMIF